MKYVNVRRTVDAVTDDTPWLDPEENRIWRGFIQASGRITAQLNDSLKANTGLTLDDYEVLAHLSESQEQRLRMSELADLLRHSQSRVTQRIDRLARRGLVERAPCPDDRRSTFAVLTDAGLEAIVAAAPLHVRDVRRVLIDRIAPHERSVLADVLERLANSARAADSR